MTSYSLFNPVSVFHNTQLRRDYMTIMEHHNILLSDKLSDIVQAYWNHYTYMVKLHYSFLKCARRIYHKYKLQPFNLYGLNAYNFAIILSLKKLIIYYESLSSKYSHTVISNVFNDFVNKTNELILLHEAIECTLNLDNMKH